MNGRRIGRRREKPIDGYATTPVRGSNNKGKWRMQVEEEDALCSPGLLMIDGRTDGGGGKDGKRCRRRNKKANRCRR